METTTMSLIIPTKNEERNLQRLLTSVKRANFNGEMIVVDANSKDKTRYIAKRFGCKVLTEKGKSSPANARMLGIKNAKRNTLIVIDADRELTKDYFKEIGKVKNWDALIVKEIKTEDTLLEKIYNARCFRHTYSLWPSVFKKYIFNKESFDTKLGFGEDEDFFNRVKGKFKIKRTNATIVIHTIHTWKELLRQWLWYGRTSIMKFKKIHKISNFSMLAFLLLPLIFSPLQISIRFLSLIIWIYEIIVIIKARKLISITFPAFDFIRGLFFLFGILQGIYKKDMGR